MAAIKAGFYTVGLAGGVESMSSNPMTWEGGVNPAIEKSKQAQSCMLPMGITSENVAAKFGLTRCCCHARVGNNGGISDQMKCELVFCDHGLTRCCCRARAVLVFYDRILPL